MKLPRSSGILLHISSLPGESGIGTLGEEAWRFADFLKSSGQRYWQILPVNPVTQPNAFSPYASTSAFAGNFLLISEEQISREKWISGKLSGKSAPEESFINYDTVMMNKRSFLESACRDFFMNAPQEVLSGFDIFCSEMAYWLDDYALFSSLAEHFNTNTWLAWEKDISIREQPAIKKWNTKLAGKIRYYKFEQFIFSSQWHTMKEYCHNTGIKLIGDIPIYVTMDSADAWANSGIFELDEETLEPVHVSGVPPDYFSKTGQLWGNPLYTWFDETGSINEATIHWWKQRLSHLSMIVDIIRIDHFRAFDAYWSVPAGEKTAVNGTWIKGPGKAFFDTVIDSDRPIDLIAEDLGVITPEVEELRDNLGLPGMKILQFAFDFNNKNYYLPCNIINHNCILYTGTHDNNTTNGWFYGKEIDDNTRGYVLEYMGSSNYNDFHQQLMRTAFSSIADLVIIPAQDILGFGGEYRMNMPGTVSGNWRWKLKKNELTGKHSSMLMRMSQLYNRMPEIPDGRNTE